MAELSFHESLQTLTATEPISYERIYELYQEHVPRVVRHQTTLADMTCEALEHLTPCAVLSVLIPIREVPHVYIEYLFWVHTLGNAEYEDLATVLRLFASYRYEIFDRIVAKMAILEDVDEKFPDILDRLKESAEA